jgi:S-phase kinase-associated protein 1
MTKVKLIPEEGEAIEVEEDIAVMSVLVKSMIDDSGAEEDIPLPNVKKTTLDRVIEFCQHHKDEPLQEIEKPLKTNNIKDVVSTWYGEFVDVKIEELYEIILAANYLDIKSLLELTCAAVAAMMKGKSIEEIRDLFNIENDFTAEEEEQIREENKWAEEAI